jgi:Flp pilus assembly protein TadD
VTAQLVKAADGFHLWSERFDRCLRDVFDIQDEIARAIVDRLRVQLSADRTLAGRPTAHPEAYCLYLQGRHWWGMFTGEAWRESVRCFKAAIAVDPAYAPPYAGVAVSHVYQAATGWARPGDVMPAAKQSALKALALDENLGEAHWAVAMVSHWHDWDWDGAESAFRKALAQNPRDGLIRILYGGALMNRGRRNQGLAEARQALEMEPISMEVNRQMIYLYCLAEQFDLAIEQGRRTLELHPQFIGTYLNLGLAYVFSGRHPEAVETFRTAAAMAGGDKFYVWGLALAYARSSRGKEAREVLDHLERTAYSPLLLAAIYAELGERDRAFGLLAEAYEIRDGLMATLGVEPSFAAIRTDPRCGELLKKMRLTC